MSVLLQAIAGTLFFFLTRSIVRRAQSVQPVVFLGRLGEKKYNNDNSANNTPEAEPGGDGEPRPISNLVWWRMNVQNTLPRTLRRAFIIELYPSAGNGHIEDAPSCMLYSGPDTGLDAEWNTTERRFEFRGYGLRALKSWTIDFPTPKAVNTFRYRVGVADSDMNVSALTNDTPEAISWSPLVPAPRDENFEHNVLSSPFRRRPQSVRLIVAATATFLLGSFLFAGVAVLLHLLGGYGEFGRNEVALILGYSFGFFFLYVLGFVIAQSPDTLVAQGYLRRRKVPIHVRPSPDEPPNARVSAAGVKGGGNMLGPDLSVPSVSSLPSTSLDARFKTPSGRSDTHLPGSTFGASEDT